MRRPCSGMDPAFSGKKVFMKLGPVRRALAAACLLPLLLAGCSDAAPTPEIPDPTTSVALAGRDGDRAGGADASAGGGGGWGGGRGGVRLVLLRDASTTRRQPGTPTQLGEAWRSRLAQPARAPPTSSSGSTRPAARSRAATTTVEAASRSTGRPARAASASTLRGRVTSSHSHRSSTVSRSTELDGTYPAGTPSPLRYAGHRDKRRMAGRRSGTRHVNRRSRVLRCSSWQSL